MKKKKVSEKENEWKGVLVDDNQDVKMYEYNKDNTKGYFYQVGESNVTPDSFTTTYTNGSDYDIDKDYCNVGVNKDWENSMFDKNGMLRTVLVEFEDPNKVNKHKQKRIDFEFTPLTFWQLLPSVAVNLHCKEIELTWLCFGMYINFKRNG